MVVPPAWIIGNNFSSRKCGRTLPRPGRIQVRALFASPPLPGARRSLVLEESAPAAASVRKSGRMSVRDTDRRQTLAGGNDPIGQFPGLCVRQECIDEQGVLLAVD